MSPKARHKARRFAMQALYQYQSSGQALHEIETQYTVANAHHKVDWDFFSQLLTCVEENLDEVDALIKPLLKDPIEKTFPVELSMLRLGTAELLHVIEVPYKVVLTEYIELAKEYGTDEGSSFVNGVLHAVAMKTRQTEIN